jgi:hypothetical protein
MILKITSPDARDKAIQDFLSRQEKQGLWKRITGG